MHAPVFPWRWHFQPSLSPVPVRGCTCVQLSAKDTNTAEGRVWALLGELKCGDCYICQPVCSCHFSPRTPAHWLRTATHDSQECPGTPHGTSPENDNHPQRCIHALDPHLPPGPHPHRDTATASHLIVGLLARILLHHCRPPGKNVGKITLCIIYIHNYISCIRMLW